MKSQKRPIAERAFSRGYQAACSGKSWAQCPFETGQGRDHWMAGWREGRADLWSGVGRKAQAERLLSL
jgi:ribosome modulation factor